MPVINRSRVNHAIFSYFARSTNFEGYPNRKNTTLLNYRYAKGNSIDLIPILDKSNPFLCTVFLFSGELIEGAFIDRYSKQKNASIGEATIGNIRFVPGFEINPNFNAFSLHHDFENKHLG